jgi:hypothetical protein
MQKTFNVSANWIEYAHGPGAEDGYKLATELCDMPVNKRGQIEIPLSRKDLIFEVQDVAELYVGGDDNNLQAARVVARCRKALQGWRP